MFVVDQSEHTKEPTPLQIDKGQEDELVVQRILIHSIPNPKTSMMRKLMPTVSYRDGGSGMTFKSIRSFEKELSIFGSKYFDIGQTLKESYEGMSKNFQLLDNVHSRCTKRDRELAGQLKDMDREMDEWRKNSSDEKEDLVARLAQSEMNRQSIVKDFILTAISMLQTSVEYQKSLAVPISLSYISSWLGDLGLGQKEEEIAKILLNINNLNIEGSKIMSDVSVAPVDDQASSSVSADHIELVNPNSANADVLLDPAEQV
ncbi:hypothetical protein Tco_1427580 [Tanacetum coccineum]